MRTPLIFLLVLELALTVVFAATSFLGDDKRWAIVTGIGALATIIQLWRLSANRQPDEIYPVEGRTK